MDNNEKKQISIELKPEIAKGSYSNLAIISHSPSEFIIDFATMLPGLQKPEVSNRIVMNPEHAKRLLNALADKITKYEGTFGQITFKEQQPRGTFDLGEFMNNNSGGAKS